MPSLPDFETISSDFAFLDDWDERYRYLIDLGKQLPEFPEDLKTEETRVRGCASQVWLAFDQEGGRHHITGDSDAAIVRGLIALLISLYSNKTAHEVMKVNPEKSLAELDLKDHITPQRSNGVTSMIERIRRETSSAEE